jgi:ribosomal protein L37AE/L43A
VTILVSLRYAGGIAAVYRDGHHAWLGAGPDTDSLGGTLLDARPAHVGMPGGRAVAGGLLPPGATSAIVAGVRAETGNGAWVAIVAPVGHEPAVRYEAADGTTVRPPLPAGSAREPVRDADEPCPACGAATWERVTSAGAAVIVCTRCGHEVDEGAWDGVGRRRRLRLRLGRRRPRVTPPAPPAIDGLDFPIYTVAGARGERAGQGWDRDGVHSVTLRHDAVAVTTRAPRRAFIPVQDECARALTSVIDDVEPMRSGRGSHAARALRIDAHRRAVAVRVARAEPFAADLPVDGERVRFSGLRDAAAWAAAADTTRARIVIAARGVAPEAVALQS